MGVVDVFVTVASLVQVNVHPSGLLLARKCLPFYPLADGLLCYPQPPCRFLYRYPVHNPVSY